MSLYNHRQGHIGRSTIWQTRAWGLADFQYIGSTPSWIIDIYSLEDQNFLVGRLSSTQVETIILQPDD